jgi:hypothetical protein
MKGNGQPKYHACSGEVKWNRREHELPEAGYDSDRLQERVNDSAKG